MLRYFVLSIVLVAFVTASAVAGNAPIGGVGTCTGMTISDPAASTQGQQQAFDDGLYTCTGAHWVPEALIVGGVDQSNTAPACNATNAGMIEYTGGSFLGCNGTSFGSLATVGSIALSGITAATGSNTITGNANYTQTWSWGTLGGNTALALTSTDMTTGTILEVENTYGGNSNGNVVYLEDVTTGGGNALYALTTGVGNSGSAGYFFNTSTASGFGVWAAGRIAISGTANSSGGTGVDGSNPYSSGTGTGVAGRSASNGSSYGVSGLVQVSPNTGYGGYFTNWDTSSASYGVYGNDESASGYGGYFTNSGGGWALYASGNSAIGSHIIVSGSAPTVTSGATNCGTSPSIAGTDNEGVVTIGTSPSGSCPVVFAAAWTNAPDTCFCTDNTSAARTCSALSITTTSMALTATTSPITASDKIGYFCLSHSL